MKKILVYVDSLKASGGIERIVYELIKEWSKRYVVDVLVKDEGNCFYGEIDFGKVISINCPRVINMNSRLQRISSTFCNSLKTICRIRRKRISGYDYYYVTTPMNAFELYSAGIESRKIVVSEHGSAYGVNKIYRIIKRFIYPKVKCVSVPNRMDVDYYNKIGSKALYIPHLVYLKGKEKNRLNTKILLNCGRLTADKRQLELLEIWNRIQDKKGWKLVIIGDGEERDNLSHYITQNNMSAYVELLPATKDIEAIYKKASLFAFTSRYEGFGLVLIEAMSYGIPCISYDCPSGPRDVVVDNINGFLIENNNCAQFQNALELLIANNFSKLSQMGENAYKFINSWDNEAILNSWYKIFE